MSLSKTEAKQLLERMIFDDQAPKESDFSRYLFFNKAIAKPPIPQGLFFRYRLSLSQDY